MGPPVLQLYELDTKIDCSLPSFPPSTFSQRYSHYKNKSKVKHGNLPHLQQWLLIAIKREREEITKVSAQKCNGTCSSKLKLFSLIKQVEEKQYIHFDHQIKMWVTWKNRGKKRLTAGVTWNTWLPVLQTAATCSTFKLLTTQFRSDFITLFVFYGTYLMTFLVHIIIACIMLRAPW